MSFSLNVSSVIAATERSSQKDFLVDATSYVAQTTPNSVQFYEPAATLNGSSSLSIPTFEPNYWALISLLVPFFTAMGNLLVILSVFCEKVLRTSTNFLIVSLAVADLLVALLVMPWAIYVLVYGLWTIPFIFCDAYIGMDVICSTASIFNLVAISIDSFQRVMKIIAAIWVSSVLIGTPIFLGLNASDNPHETECTFYDANFILASSVASFYIPCSVILVLYYKIMKAIMKQERDKYNKRISKRKKTVKQQHQNGKLTGPRDDDCNGGWFKGRSNLKGAWKRRQERRKTKKLARKREEEGEDQDMDKDSSPTEEQDPLALRPQNGIANLLSSMIRVSTNPLEKQEQEDGNKEESEANKQGAAASNEPNSLQKSNSAGSLVVVAKEHVQIEPEKTSDPASSGVVSDGVTDVTVGGATAASSAVEATDAEACSCPSPLPPLITVTNSYPLQRSAKAQADVCSVGTSTEPDSTRCPNSVHHHKKRETREASTQITTSSRHPRSCLVLTGSSHVPVRHCASSEQVTEAGAQSSSNGLLKKPPLSTAQSSPRLTVTFDEKSISSSQKSPSNGAATNGSSARRLRPPNSLDLKRTTSAPLVQMPPKSQVSSSSTSSFVGTSIRNLRRAATWGIRTQEKLQQKRERKERKATKTLGIVLGCFLFCWMPFFTCNILSAVSIKTGFEQLHPTMDLFIFTTWLGYMNSALNPVIYTLFNLEFRKAFKKILAIKRSSSRSATDKV